VAAVPGTPAHLVCDCAGGLPLAAATDTARLAQTCGACNVPAAIDPAGRSCLFLVPVRIWEGGGLRSGFSCRWFHSLGPKRLPSEVWQCCLGCPHWFPRPPDEESIPRMTEWIHRIIRQYWEPQRPASDAMVWPAHSEKDPRGRRLRQRIETCCDMVLGRRPGRAQGQGEPPP